MFPLLQNFIPSICRLSHKGSSTKLHLSVLTPLVLIHRIHDEDNTYISVANG